MRVAWLEVGTISPGTHAAVALRAAPARERRGAAKFINDLQQPPFLAVCLFDREAGAGEASASVAAPPAAPADC
jgi:hypothetical protein